MNNPMAQVHTKVISRIKIGTATILGQETPVTQNIF